MSSTSMESQNSNTSPTAEDAAPETQPETTDIEIIDVVKPDIRTLSHRELEELFKSWNKPAFHVKQLESWLYQKNAQSFDEMSNLSKDIRQRLSESYSLSVPKQVARQVSEDGTVKYLLAFPSPHEIDSRNPIKEPTVVECVAMPSKDHLSVCLSSQAGCGMGCAFCATGNAGFTRSLKAHEIYAQAQFIAKDLDRRIDRIVMMGQGEPFANYDETMAALRRFNSPNGMNIGARHITVSTCGVIPGIRRFSKEPEQFTLAISLHSAIQKTRDRLMPGVKQYSLVHLHEALQDYTDRTHRRPTYEVTLIKGVNDTKPEVQGLIDFCRDTLCHVNLIPLNETDEMVRMRRKAGGDPSVGLTATPPNKVKSIAMRLERAGIPTTVRHSRGADIDAACGQLSQKHRR